MTVRVLVVDDEPDVEALFRQQFRREVGQGLYVLDFALSGEAALNKLDGCIGEQIILMVSDINMPGMSGLDLLRKVGAAPGTAGVHDIGLRRRRSGQDRIGPRSEQVHHQAGGFPATEAGRLPRGRRCQDRWMTARRDFN
jgi:CheY-like chemotaxis protein